MPKFLSDDIREKRDAILAMSEDKTEKTITSAQLETGGKLQPEESEQFITQVRGSNRIMDLIDLEPVTNPRGKISSLWISEPITQKATEDTDHGETGSVTLGDKSYSTQKLVSGLNITTDFLRRNIEKEDFEDTLMNAVFKRIGVDAALACVRGDTGSGDNLLKSFDGFSKLSEYGHVIDAAGANLSYDLFAAAYNKFPDDKMDILDDELRWFGHGRLWTDWYSVLTSKTVSVMSESGVDVIVTPMGVPTEKINTIETGLDVAYASAVPGRVRGTKHGAFAVDSTNDTLNLNVSGGGATDHTFSHGTWTATELAKELTDSLASNGDAAVAYADQVGRLVIETTGTGAAVDIVVAAAPDSTCLTLLGIAADTYSGADADGNTIPFGTYFWLTSPNNFWVGILDQLRVYWEFKPRNDRYELTIYSEMVPKILDREAVVKVKNVLLKQYV